MAEQFAYYLDKKLHQDMRTNGNPNRIARDTYGFKDNYPEISSEFPVFDIRSALAALHYWKKSWPLEMRLEITRRIHTYIMKSTVDNTGIPQYVYAKQFGSREYDTTTMLYCGIPHTEGVSMHFASPFTDKHLPKSSQIRMLNKKHAQYAYYMWLSGEYNYDVQTAYTKDVVDVKNIEPERRKFVVDRLPMIWHYVSALIDHEYNEEESSTWVLRAYLAKLHAEGKMPDTVDQTLTFDELDCLNGSAFPSVHTRYSTGTTELAESDRYIRTDGNNWFSNFYPFEEPMKDPDYPAIKYKFPEHYYQAMKFVSFENRSLIASQPTPGKAKKAGRELEMDRENWDKVKDQYMKEAIAWKYQLGTKYCASLIASGRMPLTEYNWWHDNHFGYCTCINCIDNVHENMLGEILMDYREFLFENLYV